jgi:uncharacterized protein involved in exopolysaccharide biosynthesis
VAHAGRAVTNTPPLTLSVWIAGVIHRWRLVALIAGSALAVLAVAAFVLPHSYAAHTTFIAPTTSANAELGGESEASSITLRAALGAADAALESPLYYAKLLESEELRRRVIQSRYRDPRTRAAGDSATLLEILPIRADEPRRRMEIASRRLEKSMSVGFDLSTSVVALDARMPWSTLAADVANRIVAVADQMAQEHRSARARDRRVFIENRLSDARVELELAESRLRSFSEQNRLWRNSPELVMAEARLRRESFLAEERYRSHLEQVAKARVDELNDRARVTVVDPAVEPRKARWPRYGKLVVSAIAASLLLGLMVAGVAEFVAGQRRPVAETPSIPVVESSWLSRVGFPVFAWGLVFHSLIITVLFGWIGLSVDTVRSIAAWKEAALMIFLCVVIVRALMGRGPRATIAWPDLWVGGLVATALMYLLIENLWLRFDLPRGAELLGFRDAVYFMLLYFVGRSMPELAAREGAMKKVFVIVLITGIIGVIERMIVSPEMLVALGVAAYFQDFLGVSAFTVGNAYGLPLNYWTMIGGELFRRAGSVYLSGQGFAVPFILLFPLATAWVFLRPTRSRGQIIAYAIISTALVLTLTRMTILIALIQLVLFVSLIRRPVWAVGGVAIATATFLAAFTFIPGFPTFVWQTLSWQEGSSVSHVNDWVNGISIFFQNPWGAGLGTADQTAVRSGLPHLTGDNLYLKYGVEMGALGLALLVCTLVAIGRSGLRLYRRGSTYAQQRMGITLWLAAIGISINGITAVVFNSITLGWLFFWLAGAVVTASQALPRTDERVAAAV